MRFLRCRVVFPSRFGEATLFELHGADANIPAKGAYEESGCVVMQWFAGMAMAALPVIYGVYSIQRAYTTMFGSRGASERISGDAGLAFV